MAGKDRENAADEARDEKNEGERPDEGGTDGGGREKFDHRGGGLQVEIEKIGEDLAVGALFEGGNPGHLEVGEFDPAEGAEFARFLVDIDFGCVGADEAEEVGLFLSVEAVFADFFGADFFGVEILVAAVLFEDGVVLGEEADFLVHFAVESFEVRFAWIDAALRELPRAGDVVAFADEELSFMVNH